MADLRVLVVTAEAAEAPPPVLRAGGSGIAFAFREPQALLAGAHELEGVCAVALQIDCATPPVLEALRGAAGEPPVFLFRREPPLREMARWLALQAAGAGGGDGRLLSESLEFYGLASLYRQCLDIMAARDRETLLGRITETFARELAADGVVVWLARAQDPDEMTIASVRGFLDIDREGSRFFLSQVDWGDRIRGKDPFLLEERPRAQVKAPSPLYVPLVAGETPVGLVKLGPRADRRPYGERERQTARLVAEYAALSLRAAWQAARMEQASLRDPETRAHSAAFLADYLEKELYRAARFGRPLSLILLVIPNFAFLVERTRESLVAGALAAVAEEIRTVLRDSDLLARLGPDRFCALLPETDAFGAALAARRLRKAIRPKGTISFLGSEYRLQSFVSCATFPQDGRTFEGLVRAAEEGYQRQQRSPFHRLMLQEKSFWDAYDVLVGTPEHYERLAKGEEVPFFSRVRRDLGRNAHFILPREAYLGMVEAVAQDAAAASSERGLVIAAGPRPEVLREIFASFAADQASGRRIYLVGRGGAARFDARHLLYVAAEDERLAGHEVVLFLRERSAYGLFALDEGERVCGFNTADRWLVDGMMEKLQDLYLLQGHF